MNWSRRYSIITGVVLVLVANLTVLLGVAYNHSGMPDSWLSLTQRELEIPYQSSFNSENNGNSLRLKYRFPGAQNPYQRHDEIDPNWLNKAKLASLGFNVDLPIDTNRSRTTFEKQLSKAVFLVLEFDGTAYQQAIELAKKKDAEDLMKKEADGDTKNQPVALIREMTMNSRLFVIDAGLNRNVLRAKYPDRLRYCIVHGEIQPRVIYNKEKQPFMTGYAKDVSAQFINVPSELRGVFEAGQKKNLDDGYVANDKLPSFEATVAFGRRLEPWILTASKK